MNTKITEEQAGNLFMADFWKRLAAWLVDQIIIALPIIPPLYLFSKGPYPYIEAAQVVALANLAYFTILEGSRSQTVGKILIGIVVYDENGRKVSYTSALLRRIGLVVPILQLFDAGMIFFNSMKQRIFDIVAGTVVLEKGAESDATKFLRGEDITDSLVERGVITREPYRGAARDRRIIKKLSEMIEEVKKKYEEGELEKEQYLNLRRKYEVRIDRLKERFK